MNKIIGQMENIDKVIKDSQKTTFLDRLFFNNKNNTDEVESRVGDLITLSAVLGSICFTSNLYLGNSYGMVASFMAMPLFTIMVLYLAKKRMEKVGLGSDELIGKIKMLAKFLKENQVENRQEYMQKIINNKNVIPLSWWEKICAEIRSYNIVKRKNKEETELEDIIFDMRENDTGKISDGFLLKIESKKLIG